MNNPDTSPQESQTHSKLVRSPYLPLAGWLVAAKKLKYFGCHPINGSWKCEFLFYDPEGQFPQLRMEYDAGAEVSAPAFYAAIGYLRQEMNTKRNSDKGNDRNNAPPR